MANTSTHKSRAQKSAAHRTKARRRSPLEYQREREAYTRFKNNWLKFWLVCGSKRCRRHKACSGDAQACWDEKWALAPERFKLRVKLAFMGLKRGLSLEEAVRHSNEQIAREDAEEIAPQRNTEMKAMPPPAATPDESGPRLRQV